MAVHTIRGYSKFPDVSVEISKFRGLNSALEELIPQAVKGKYSAFLGVVGHRIVCDFYGNGLYVIGGRSCSYGALVNPMEPNRDYVKEIRKFNFSTCTWSILNSENAPTHLLGICNLGIDRSTGHCNLLALAEPNETFIYDIDDQKWTQLETNGPSPIGYPYVNSDGDPDVDQGHRKLAKSGDHLYLAIGYREMPNGRMEIRHLNLDTFILETLSDQNTNDAPYGRKHFEILVDFEERIYILGGEAQENDLNFIMIPYFDSRTRKWHYLHTFPDPNSGYPESPRTDIGCVIHADYAYMIGGQGLSALFDEIWRLHLPSGQWSKFQTTLPHVMREFAVDIDPDGILYVYGGYVERSLKSSNRLWKTRLAMQTLRRLAWDTVAKYAGRNLVNLSDDELRKLPLPGAYLRKIMW